eukprot:TRINITY_DN9526_c0_g1_i3.p1 TRINITY_DN9526_c0_g1~~TRINITY_DN9526_c0_g1_i3.p1  ORF type:complete len:1084 (+),score=226.96 TRINITY_DN9526_c0_g1_i3:349-3252(+)
MEMDLRDDDEDEDDDFQDAQEIDALIKQDRNKRFKKRSTNAKTTLPYELVGTMGLANRELAAGNWERAKELCEQVASKADQCMEPYVTLALIHREQGNLQDAVRYKMLMLDHIDDPEDFEWIDMAELYEQVGDHQKALNAFRRAHRYDQDPEAALHGMARAFDQLKEYQRAVASYLNIFSKMEHVPFRDLCTLFKLSESMIKAKTNRRTRKLAFDSCQMLHQELNNSKRPEEELRGLLKMLVDLAAQISQVHTTVEDLIKHISLATVAQGPRTCKTTQLLLEGKSLAELRVATDEQWRDLEVAARKQCITVADKKGQRSSANDEALAALSETLWSPVEDLAVTTTGQAVPDNVSPWFRAKLGMALLSTGPDDRNVPGLLHPILYFDPVVYYPEYVEAMEALLRAHRAPDALVFARRIRSIPALDKPAAQVAEAKCMLILGLFKEATALVTDVLERVPKFVAALSLRDKIREAMLKPPSAANNVLKPPPVARNLKNSSALREADAKRKKDAAAKAKSDAPKKKAKRSAPRNEDRMLSKRGADTIVQPVELKAQYEAALAAFSQHDFDRTIEIGLTMLHYLLSDCTGSPPMQMLRVYGRCPGTQERTKWLKYTHWVGHTDPPLDDSATPHVFLSIGLAVEEWYKLSVRVVESLLRRERFAEALEVTDLFLNAKMAKFMPTKTLQTVVKLLKVDSLRGCLRIEEAYKMLREMLLEDDALLRAWSDLYQVSYTTGVEGANWLHRFFIRRLFANPDMSMAHMTIGNHSLVSSTYNFALGGYVNAHELPGGEGDLALLCSAVACFRRLMQRSCSMKNAVLLRGTAILSDYGHERNPDGRSQEAMFNYARAYHLTNTPYIATPLYAKAMRQASEIEARIQLLQEHNKPLAEPDTEHLHRLSTGSQFGPSSINVRDQGLQPYINARAALPLESVAGVVSDSSSLAPESAFNLSHIYHQAGSRSLATHVLRNSISF